MRLIEESLTPLYQQLMEDIKSAIEEGRYQPEEKIPSEPELSELYCVSRITVRINWCAGLWTNCAPRDIW